MSDLRLEEIVRESGSLPEDEREAYLSRVCFEDPALTRTARRLLAFPASPDLQDAAAEPVHAGVSASGIWSPLPAALGSRSKNWAVLPAGLVLAHRYRIEAFLASGGMGRVYRVHDLELDATLALKTLHPDIASDPASLRRFKQEVLLARSVTHPHVCRIFDLSRDEERNLTFLTMEYLRGETLGAYLRRNGPLAAEQALIWVRQLAEALDTAHRVGIVHRDLKSANVMIVTEGGEGRAVITDFGLAIAIERGAAVEPGATVERGAAVERRATVEPGATVERGAAVERRATVEPGPANASDALASASHGGPRSTTSAALHLGPIVGTPAYMSPEQVRGGPVGPASDLYALGVVLFEMRTGQLPFPAATPRAAALAHLTMDPRRPGTLAPVEAHWEETILRLLAKDPARRFASAREVVLALEGRLERETKARFVLPAEPDALVGRGDELLALAEALESSSRPGTRVLTVVGPGGTGKTRLATSYGWASLSRWPGGVWFCDLSETRSREGIVSAVATALEVPLGKEDPIVQLGHAIAGRGKSLVVLDNFEQVAEHAAETLGRWVERATEARFLVTSRERLHVGGETVLELEPLHPGTHGVELFAARAQAQRPGFRIDPSNRAQVGAIVEQLEGLPLAIELAAARLRLLSLEQLGERLRDRFHVLAGGKRGRHEALKTTFDWSWELLEPREQRVLAQVSVFEGGFTLEAAEAVVDLGDDGGEWLVLDRIQSLMDKSWLRSRVVREAPRIDLYVTVREYAAEKRREQAGAGDRTAAEAEVRHGRYFALMGTEEALESLDRHGGVARRLALQREMDNLVAACRRAGARGDPQTAVPTYRAASAVLQDREPKTSLQLGREVLAGVTEDKDRARVLAGVAHSKRLLGQMKEAAEDCAAALVIHRRVGDRRGEGAVLCLLGDLLKSQGRTDEAREHYATALTIHREVGNRRSEAIALEDLGFLHRNQGRMEEARKHYAAALAIYREAGDRRSEGILLGKFGILHAVQGRMEEARADLEAALAIHRELGNRRGEGNMLADLGLLHEKEGRGDAAREKYEAALAIHRDVGNRKSEAVVLGNLGSLHGEQGRIEDARRHYESALAILREVGDREGEGGMIGNIGMILRAQGRYEAAREHLKAALAIHREMGDRLSEGLWLRELGILHQEQAQVDEARMHLAAALAIQRDVGNPRELGKTLAAAADVELQRGNADAARSLLVEAESIVADLALDSESELARTVERIRQRVRPG